MKLNYIKTLEGHSSMIFALCNDLSGNGFYSAAGDGYVIHWEAGEDEIGTVIARTDEQIMSLFTDNSHSRILNGSLKGNLTALYPDNPLQWRKVKILKGGIFAILEHEGRLYISGDQGLLMELHPESLIPQRSYQLSNIRCRAIRSLDDIIICGTSEGYLISFDPKDFKMIARSEMKHNGSVFDFVITGEHIISAGKDGKIMIWDHKLRFLSMIQAHNSTINSLVSLGTSGMVASACRDASIRIWDTASMDLLKSIDLYNHSGHLRSVNKLLWNQAGSLLISASDDRKVKVWKIS